MKKKLLALSLSLAMAFSLAACGGNGGTANSNTPAGDGSDDGLIQVGFAQVGHESDWRTASTKSAQDVFSEENGYELSFVDCDNDSAVQLDAVRNFIQQGMDYIIIDPIVDTGWDAVLTECEDAGIPVIVIDRTITDSDKYTAWVGSDFKVEGLACGEWLKAFAADKGIEEINALVIEGGKSVFKFLCVGNRVSRRVGCHSFQLDVAVVGVAQTESGGGEHFGAGQLYLLLLSLDLLLQQFQLGTLRNVGIEVEWRRNGDDGVGECDFGVETDPDDIAQGQSAQVHAIAGLLQLVIDFTALGLDAQEVVGRCHLSRDADPGLAVEGVYLLDITFEHGNFPAGGQVGPVGVVGIGNDLHAGLALVFGRT